MPTEAGPTWRHLESVQSTVQYDEQILVQPQTLLKRITAQAIIERVIRVDKEL
jgi:hypothetical protein